MNILSSYDTANGMSYCNYKEIYEAIDKYMVTIPRTV